MSTGDPVSVRGRVTFGAHKRTSRFTKANRASKQNEPLLKHTVVLGARRKAVRLRYGSRKVRQVPLQPVRSLAVCAGVYPTSGVPGARCSRRLSSAPRTPRPSRAHAPPTRNRAPARRRTSSRCSPSRSPGPAGPRRASGRGRARARAAACTGRAGTSRRGRAGARRGEKRVARKPRSPPPRRASRFAWAST